MKLKFWDKVFNSDNTVKACGRDTCRQLIVEANTKEPGVKHGDVQSGYMNIESLIKLHEKED